MTLSILFYRWIQFRILCRFRSQSPLLSLIPKLLAGSLDLYDYDLTPVTRSSCYDMSRSSTSVLILILRPRHISVSMFTK